MSIPQAFTCAWRSLFLNWHSENNPSSFTITVWWCKLIQVIVILKDSRQLDFFYCSLKMFHLLSRRLTQHKLTCEMFSAFTCQTPTMEPWIFHQGSFTTIHTVVQPLILNIYHKCEISGYCETMQLSMRVPYAFLTYLFIIIVTILFLILFSYFLFNWQRERCHSVWP